MFYNILNVCKSTLPDTNVYRIPLKELHIFDRQLQGSFLFRFLFTAVHFSTVKNLIKRVAPSFIFQKLL